MRFNSQNEKKISFEDLQWLKENLYVSDSPFTFSEIKPNNLISGEKNVACVFLSGNSDSGTNKRFVKEFQKFIDRYERIHRDKLWESSYGNYDDKLKLLVLSLHSFQYYRNKISHNSFIKCLEHVANNFLNQIDKKIAFTCLFSLFDYKEESVQKRFETIFEDSSLLKDVNEIELLKREYELTLFLDGDTKVEQKKIAFEDLKRIKDKEVIIAYRGFIVPNNTDIRMSRSLPKDYKHPNSNLTYEHYKTNQLQGFGFSYTFDKRVAYSHALLTNSNLRYYFNNETTKSRACIGQYFIQTKHIFSYTNCRSEREIICSKRVPLLRYEFISNNKLQPEPKDNVIFSGKHKLACYTDTSKSAIHNLLPHCKIHKIFNNTEKLENYLNEVNT